MKNAEREVTADPACGEPADSKRRGPKSATSALDQRPRLTSRLHCYRPKKETPMAKPVTPREIAADIASAFAVHNFNLGNGRLEAEPMDELRAAIERAVLAEREACAKIATSFFDQPNLPRQVFAGHGAGNAIADAIRNRKGG